MDVDTQYTTGPGISVSQASVGSAGFVRMANALERLRRGGSSFATVAATHAPTHTSVPKPTILVTAVISIVPDS
jgi:hypothetical protein